jgi:hypothetical protein
MIGMGSNHSQQGQEGQKTHGSEGRGRDKDGVEERRRESKKFKRRQEEKNAIA